MTPNALLTAPAPPLLLPARVPITTIVSVSGGMSSAFALKLALDKYPKVSAVFADVKGTGHSHFWSDLPEVEYLLHERFGGEGRSNYRFVWQLSYALDIPIARVEDGRTIWAVAGQHKMFRLYIAGRFFCKASELLKREVIAKHIEAHYQPGNYRIALGMGVLEPHRIKNAQAWWRVRLGWDVEVFSPIIEEYKQTGKAYENGLIMAWAKGLGLDMPDAYEEGFEHANCSEQCFMAGQGHFERLWNVRPQHYQYAAWQEQRVTKYCGFDATILKDERGKETRKMSLNQFVERIKVGDVNRRQSEPCACNVYLPMAEFVASVPLKAKFDTPPAPVAATQGALL